MPFRKRYAVVGTGGRCRMFLDAIYRDFSEHAELAGLCDLSATRANYWSKYLSETYGIGATPTFTDNEFDAMIEQARPDVVIVTSMDCTHHTYIARAMDLGCDVITEKPMTTDAQKAGVIRDAIERTGRSLRVTFNYRYMPTMSLVKEVVDRGDIGTPTLVDFQWRLDTSHGADYFRRWHREKDKSGGLLVHKSTHHFDLVNWILGDRPQTVFAMGDLRFYGEKNAKARGVDAPYDRYTGHTTRAKDPFALTVDGSGEKTWQSDELIEVYHKAEADSGYIRDRNVFGGENKWPITAEDTMSVNACYSRGALLNYSLIAYCPWEGERLTITGTEGQVEYFARGKGHVIRGQSEDELTAEQYQGEKYVRLQRMFEQPIELDIPEATGGHGGGDRKLLERIFSPDPPPDALGRDAGFADGMSSILMGICANQSIVTGQPVQTSDVFAL
ncbi:MAG: Gfo/Idh/MocA family oxidoreductase [Planctomycetota bacterium]